jgi:hypothetical protein
LSAGGNTVNRLVVAAIILLLPVYAMPPKPNLSGKWVLDKDRSFSNPAGLDQTMTIVHNGNDVKVDAVLKTSRGETAVSETWTIDGQERGFTPPGTAAASGRRVASWLPGDRGILVRDETVTESTKGAVTQVVTRKYTLSADAQTLTVDYYSDTPRGSFESKRVFVRH